MYAIYLASLLALLKKMERGDSDSAGSTLRTAGIVVLVVAIVLLIGAAVMLLGHDIVNFLSTATFSFS